MAGKTTFMIAQRISSVLTADQILVLDHGRIVGPGHAPGTARKQPDLPGDLSVADGQWTGGAIMTQQQQRSTPRSHWPWRRQGAYRRNCPRHTRHRQPPASVCPALPGSTHRCGPAGDRQHRCQPGRADPAGPGHRPVHRRGRPVRTGPHGADHARRVCAGRPGLDCLWRADGRRGPGLDCRPARRTLWPPAGPLDGLPRPPQGRRPDEPRHQRHGGHQPGALQRPDHLYHQHPHPGRHHGLDVRAQLAAGHRHADPAAADGLYHQRWSPAAAASLSAKCSATWAR